MYYIQQDEKIVLFDEDKQKLQDTILFMPQYQGLEIKEVEEGYVIYDLELMTIEEMKAKEAQKERERLNHLTCTALDIATLIKTLGLTDAEILQFLNANPSLLLKLTLCKDVYCEVVRQLCPLKITETLTLTDDMVVGFFKKKHNIK